MYSTPLYGLELFLVAHTVKSLGYLNHILVTSVAFLLRAHKVQRLITI